MTITQERPSVAERVASAGGSSDLSVDPEKRGDADYLIAAAKAPAVIGRYVYQLMSEWDGCAKPRMFAPADIERLAEHLPRVKVQKRGKRGLREVDALDLVGARAEADAWQANERRRVLQRLPSLRRLVDEHAGLLPWVTGLGVEEPRLKLLDVLGWWADRRCLVCEGTGKCGDLGCKSCKGSGERRVPHGQEGRLISDHIGEQVSRAAASTRRTLNHLPAWKKLAAGIG